MRTTAEIYDALTEKYRSGWADTQDKSVTLAKAMDRCAVDLDAGAANPRIPRHTAKTANTRATVLRSMAMRLRIGVIK